MKLKRNYLEASIFIVVYLFAIYMWTLPFQDNRVPYGEFDAISHWGLGDFIAQYDKTFVYLPPFLDYTYWGDHKFKPHTLWYYPPLHYVFSILFSLINFVNNSKSSFVSPSPTINVIAFFKPKSEELLNILTYGSIGF